MYLETACISWYITSVRCLLISLKLLCDLNKGSVYFLSVQEGAGLCCLWSSKECISNCVTKWKCGWCSICCSSGYSFYQRRFHRGNLCHHNFRCIELTHGLNTDLYLKENRIAYAHDFLYCVVS